MLSTAEDVCGPYVWGVYDLLVLPPSFPFGGMENPCLTFVTPTMIVNTWPGFIFQIFQIIKLTPFCVRLAIVLLLI